MYKNNSTHAQIADGTFGLNHVSLAVDWRQMYTISWYYDKVQRNRVVSADNSMYEQCAHEINIHKDYLIVDEILMRIVCYFDFYIVTNY